MSFMFVELQERPELVDMALDPKVARALSKCLSRLDFLSSGF
jgi:hypothetical protein